MRRHTPGPGARHILTIVGAALVLAANLTTNGWAQEDPPTDIQHSRQETASTFNEDTRFTVDFPGGTVTEYLKMVHQAASQAGHEGPLNIVVTDSARDYVLPSIEIKTTLDGAVGCLEACATEFQEVFVESDITGDLLFIIMRDHRDPPVVQVMNVKAILVNVDKEDFVSAIGIGLEMAGGDPDGVDMKLHEETGLFFVKGPLDRIEVIQQIVQQLDRGGGPGGPTP